MMKKISISALALCFLLGMTKSNAQTIEDAVRVSQYSMFGTASYVGRAGAIGALGADFTAASYNPAGLGIYGRSDLMISSSITRGSTSSSYYGSTNDDSRSGYSPAPFGIVANINVKDQNAVCKNWQMGFGVNRLKSYSNQYFVSGKNPQTSIINAWTEDANYWGSLEPFSSELTPNWLITDNNDGTYSTFMAGGQNQTKRVEEWGGISEMVFSFSGNLSNLVYLGATIGVPFLDYNMNSNYTETATETTTDPLFRSLNYNQFLDMSGVGVNLKVGAIVRPLDWLRIGFAVHTPTYYDVSEDYGADLATNGNNDYYTDGTTGTSNYSMTTPYKLLGSLGFILGNQSSPIAGSIGLDYEYSDYSIIHYSLRDGAYQNTLNQFIKQNTAGGHVFRAGGTLNIQKLTLRAGYAYSASVYKEKNEGAQNTFTAGIGYRSQFWYFDFAYANTQQKRDEYLYVDNYDPASALVKQTRYTNFFIGTLGFRF